MAIPFWILAEGPKLTRDLTFSKEWPEGFYFRVARTESEEGFQKAGEAWKLSNGLLFTSSVPATMVPVGEGQELRIALQGLAGS